MKDEDKIQDWRSTGRRKGRRALYASMAEYKCVGYTDPKGIHHSCGKTSKEPPKDAPSWFDEIWPTELRVLDSQLQVDHESKDHRNNDEEYLNWRCPSCHKLQDSKTEVGEATVKRSFF